jgi:hypothetical protein
MSRTATTLAVSALLVLAGCGGTGNGPTGPGVRAINAINSAAVVAVNSGSNSIAPALPYATESGNTRTPYTILPVGSNPVTFTNATTQIASTTLNLINQEDVNVIASPSNTGDILVLSDNTAQLTDSEIRFVNVTTIVHSADFVLTLEGAGPLQPLTAAAGAVNPVQPAFPGFLYLPVTSGTYQFQVYPTGQEGGTALIDEEITLVAGQRWTFILVDPHDGLTSPELIQVEDSQQLQLTTP